MSTHTHTHTLQVFTPMTTFHGIELKVGYVPWSHHMQLAEEEGEEGEEAWGYEIDMLASFTRLLNFTYR